MAKLEEATSWLPKAIAAFILLILLWGSFYTISAGHRGVLLTFGKAHPVPAGEGLHFKIPIVQSVVKMSVQTLKYEADSEAASKDLQVVHSTIAVNYRLSEESAATLYTNIGINYEDRVIQPAVQESVKSITAQFTAEELITKRNDVKSKLQTQLHDRLLERGINVEEISVTNFDFSESFNYAIEQKVTAEQLKLKAERDLERIEIEARQIEAQAEGQAKAISTVRTALGPGNYIEWLKIQKWNGELPQVTGATPFVNVGTITGGQMSQNTAATVAS